MSVTADNEWAPDEDQNTLTLDAAYDKILPGSYVIVQKPSMGLTTQYKTFGILSADTVPRTAYGISAKTTQLKLEPDGGWFDEPIIMDVIRKTAVLAQSEKLELAERPILNTKGTFEDISGDTIELDDQYDGIQSGRWIIVSGERTDIDGTTGVVASELVMVASVQNTTDRTLPGDTAHTTLTLANALAYKYKRDTVTINANVVKATHGETRTEVLGSGDASKSLQQFTLKQSPLTYVSASTIKGTSSTLKVRVNEILWHECENLEGLAPTARSYVPATDDEAKTSITFGNGRQGSRLPTGTENVKAVYRTGIGSIGNIKAGQISLLATKPLGVKSVINPIRASGGADRENLDQARHNAPLVTMTLDRLVSVEDYADYARTFAGIGKTDARIVVDGIRKLVHLTITGADDIPIDETSDLYQNLKIALYKYGDPYQPVIIAVREPIAILISAKVKLLPDYAWDNTEPSIRKALLDAFSFDRRELGQNVYSSEVISVIKGVPGVDYIEMDTFKGLTQAELLEIMEGSSESSEESKDESDLTPVISVSLARFDNEDRNPVKEILPAQLAYLLPDVPDTLILNEVKE